MATAKARWEKLNGKRNAILDRGRQAADLTIPALMPPEGHNENSDLSSPYQSLGARGLNNVASKLSMALLPAGNPFFRFKLDDDVLAELGSESTQIEEQLRLLENEAMDLVESGNLRIAIHSALKQLACTGNVLLFMPKKGGARVFRLTQYCVVRDAMGSWYEIVVQEKVHPSTLDTEIKAAVELDVSDEDDEDVELYTWVRREGNKVKWHQEINDKIVPKSEGRVSDPAKSPYIPLRWTSIENEDYGRGLVEEYLGDLRSLEDLSKSIVAISVASAKVVFLERPNSTTDIEALNKAESGEFVEGNEEDISVVQIEKFNDFTVAKQTADDLTQRLSHAFLLTTGTVRHAERVTAAEVRLQAQELEDVLGGVYTVLAQELQLPLVRRLIEQMRADGTFPNLADDVLEPVIVTGFDALGRGHELNKYRAFFSDGMELFGEAFLNEFSPARTAQLMATHHNVDIGDIRKTEDEKEQEQQQRSAEMVADKAAGPVAGAVASAAADSAVNNQ